MISVNEYFDAKVKSLGYENGGKSTIGVMEPGEYEFGTGAAEIMSVIEGELIALLPEATDWVSFKAGESFNVPGDSKFQVKAVGQTAYLCKYL